jgi:VHS domain
MFRAQANQFDDAVGKLLKSAQANVSDIATAKATDENLTSENWEYILDVCDKVTGSDSGSKDVVAAMIKRLAHRNANVQLYTLELANALSQNCGLPVHRELASKSFTDALLRLAADRVSLLDLHATGSDLTLLEHAPASQVQDTGADGRMDRDVQERS